MAGKKLENHIQKFSNPRSFQEDLRLVTESTYRYCRERDFSGWDPYDGLNSRLFKALRLNRSSLARLLFIQFFKRSPVNFRPFFLVPKERNPKGIGLFASAAFNLYRATGNQSYFDDGRTLLEWLVNNHSRGWSGYAWGYNFPWQSRATFKHAFEPTIVATSFVAMSFLDGYDLVKDEAYLEIAKSAASFIFNDLNKHHEGRAVSYSYGPNDTGKIYNATALGAQFLARLYKATGDSKYGSTAREAMEFVASRQRTDGSWPYGDHENDQWIDSFHTGFNLMSLKEYRESTGDGSFDETISKGYEFYKSMCFTPKGEPKYYSNRYFPVDIHNCAVAILMFTRFGKPDRARELVDWTLKTMLNKRGFFDYQITPYYRNSIPYMRWSQAWVVWALSELVTTL